jgi:hypothetical protein
MNGAARRPLTQQRTTLVLIVAVGAALLYVLFVRGGGWGARARPSVAARLSRAGDGDDAPLIYDASPLFSRYCIHKLTEYTGGWFERGGLCTLPFPSWAAALCVRAPHLCDAATGAVPCAPLGACHNIAGVLPGPSVGAALEASGGGIGYATPMRELTCGGGGPGAAAGPQRRCRWSSDVLLAASADAVLLQHVGMSLYVVTLDPERRHALLWPPERTAAARGTGREQLWAMRGVAEPPTVDSPLALPALMAAFNFTFGSYRNVLHDGFELSYALDWAAALAARVDPASKAAAGAPWRKASVLFASSNCNSLSGREAWVAEFMRHVPVDSVGRCLNNRDGDAGGPAGVPPHMLMREDSANFNDALAAKHALAAAYKFVLAVENTVAPDYVTEKFYDPLEAGAVPIYLGAPNIDDFAPGAGAFIDARGRTPADVAAEVAAADADDALYARYHAWRSDPAAARSTSPLAQREAASHGLEHHLCALCDRVAAARGGGALR